MSTADHQVIQIEDEGDKDYSAPKNTAETQPETAKVFKHNAFPRLSSILQKHVKKQANIARQDEKQEEQVIQLMPHTNDQIEVTQIIPVLPLPQQGDQLGAKNNDGVVQEEQKQQFHQETELTINQDDGPILMVQEDVQPIVSFCPTINRQAEFQLSPLVLLQEEVKQTLLELQQNTSQFGNQLQIIHNLLQTQEREIVPNDTLQAPELLFQQVDDNGPSNLIAQPMEIEQSKQIVQSPIQQLQQINHQPEQTFANGDFSTANIQAGQRYAEQRQQEQLTERPSINQNVAQMKMKIVSFLPELAATLVFINDEQIINIYKSIQQKIKSQQTESQPLQSSIIPQQNPSSQQQLQPKEKNLVTDHIVSSQIPEQQIDAQQNVSFQICAQEAPQQTENINEIIECDMNLQPVNQQLHTSPNPEPNFQSKQPSFSQIQEKTVSQENSDQQSFKNTVKQFQQLKDANIDELRDKMIQYFPDNREDLLMMNHEQLKGILNEAMEQFQKQTQVTSIQKQPISVPVNQTQQKQTMDINTFNQKSITPPIAMSTHQQIPQSLDSITKDQIDVDLVQIIPSLAEMKTELLNLLPNLRNEIQCMIDERDIKQLYYQAKKNNLIIRENKKNTPKKTVRPSNLKNLSYNEILKICLEKFPNLKDEIKKLSEEEIRKIYEQIQSKISVNSKSLNPKPTNTEPVQQTEQHQVQKQQTSFKRTHEMMMGTNKKPMEDLRAVQSQEKNSAKRKQKVNISEIRLKLVTKFPHLKERIMQIDDLEIEKIYFESITTPENKPAARVEEKPKTIENDKQISTSQISVPSINDSLPNGKSTVIESKQGKTQVYDINNIQKSKNCRTIVLVHTEELNSEEDGDIMHKIFRSEKGLEKKCLCECCKTTDVTDLLRRLVCSLTKK